jgi:hypothetical protein
MNAIAALVPPVVVCAAFIAILVAVKRHSDREDREESQESAESQDQSQD